MYYKLTYLPFLEHCVYKHPHLYLLALLLLEQILKRGSRLEIKLAMPDGPGLDEACLVYCNGGTVIPKCMQLLITTG